MREEEITITCDRCKQKIENIYTNYPIEVRYWHCEPVFCQHDRSGIIYAVHIEPPNSKDYCIKCWREKEKEK